MRLWRKITKAIFVVLLLVLLAGFVLVHVPKFQTIMIQRVTENISSGIDGNVSVGNVSVAMFDKFALENVIIVAGEADTVVVVDKVLLDLAPLSMFRGNFKIRRVNIDGGSFFLNIKDSTSNLAMLFADNSKLADTENVESKENEIEMSFDGKLFDISLKRLRISKFNVFIKNHDAVPPKISGTRNIEWNDIALRDINLDMADVVFSDGELRANIRRLTAEERKGLKVDTFTGLLTLNGNKIVIDDMVYRDDFSHLRCNYFSMGFGSFADFGKFTDKVVLGLKTKGSLLDLTSIGYFAPGMDNINLRLYLNGEITGPVADLKTDNLRVQSGTRQTSILVSARLTGLPDFMTTKAYINVKDCATTVEDIEKIIFEVTPNPHSVGSISKFSPRQKVVFNGYMQGLFRDFRAEGNLSSGVGNVSVDARFCSNRDNGFEIDGEVAAHDVALGTILESKQLGKLSCNASVKALFSNGSPYIDIRRLNISNIGFNGYDYSRITAMGQLKDSEFDGRVVSRDPNLNFLFHGLISLSQKENSRYRFDLNMGYANLAALNFHKREISELQFVANADFVRRNDHLFGNIALKNLECRNEVGFYNVGDLTFRSVSMDDRYAMKLNSSFIDADYRGDVPVTELLNDIIARTETGNYTMNILTKDLRPVCSFLLPEFYVDPGTRIELSSSKDSVMTASLTSQLIAYRNNYVKDLAVSLKNENDTVKASIDNELFQMGNTKFTANRIFASLVGDSATVSVAVNGSDSLMNGIVNVAATFPDGIGNPKNIKADVFDSRIIMGDQIWKFYPSKIGYCDTLLNVERFGLYSGKQSLLANGYAGRLSTDTMKVALNDFDISLANLFVGNVVTLGGKATGNVNLVSLFKGAAMFANLHADSLSVANHLIGDLQFISRWDAARERVAFRVNNVLGNSRTLNSSGFYDIDSKIVTSNLSLKDFAVGFSNPFLTGILNDVEGYISADMAIKGPMNALSVKCDNGRIHDFCGTVDFTRVPYRIDGHFEIDDKGLRFKDTRLFDMEGHKADVTGGVQYDRFKNARLNTVISAKNIQALNTTASDNETFYGKGYATGDIKIFGPLDGLKLNIDIITDDKTSIHVPLSSSAKDQTSLLRFINPDRKLSSYDSLVRKNTRRRVKSNNALDVKVSVNATPQAEILLEINKDMGDVLKTRGTGLIDIAVEKGNFGIKGDYGVTEGSYKFVLMGLVSRDFTLNPGGSIKFNGDIMDSDLNLTATYHTKASLTPLIADSTSVSTRRNVNCGIGITGKLANPKIGFDIDVPDLDPTIKSHVESALNTEDKVLRQFVTLLLSGSFIPDGQSGIVNNTSLSFFNATEILSNQINSVFRQLDIPLDLGFNYQPGVNGRNIFDVAISTQLFNNRVTINGNIGNKQYVSTNNQEVVGDVDVEVKLDKKGKISMTLFSHSADEYSNYLDQTQRNGAGITYREEFDSFKELLNRMLVKNKKK